MADGLNVELYKHVRSLLKFRLLHVFTNCWKRARTPSPLKFRIVLPIHDKGNKDERPKYKDRFPLNSEYKLCVKIIRRLSQINSEDM